MARPSALLRAGFPYDMTLGMRRVTSNAVDLALGNEDRVYVLCRGGLGMEIRILNWADDNLGTIGTGKFQWPSSVLCDSDENLYVSDEAHNKVFVFNKDGEETASWGTKGTGDGEFDRPTGMSFDENENILLSDAQNHRVQKYAKDGKFISQFGEYGEGDGRLNMPWGTTVDEVGDIYVADWRNDRIQKFTADGRFIMKLGSSGSGPGMLNRPTGVAVDSDGDIYVADWGNNRIQLFTEEGRYVEQFIGDSVLSRSAQQYILANPVTLRLREMADLEPTKRFRAPIYVRLGDEGRMLVPDFGSHRVQVYKKNAIPLSESEIAPLLRNPILLTT